MNTSHLFHDHIPRNTTVFSKMIPVILKKNFYLFLRILETFFKMTEAVAQSCSVKKVFSQFLQKLQENTCARVPFLSKVTALMPATLLRKRLQHRCFPLNFTKFVRTFSYRTPPVAAS